jgi:hypothetical protein
MRSTATTNDHNPVKLRNAHRNVGRRAPALNDQYSQYDLYDPQEDVQVPGTRHCHQHDTRGHSYSQAGRAVRESLSGSPDKQPEYYGDFPEFDETSEFADHIRIPREQQGRERIDYIRPPGED